MPRIRSWTRNFVEDGIGHVLGKLYGNSVLIKNIENRTIPSSVTWQLTQEALHLMITLLQYYVNFVYKNLTNH
ncbi:unnamed protein product [Adineta steineri]|uniref:Uncharacterized protein n=1 Tax=Adineta steineri TaxID=433720 RepID=A0A815UFR8_9BILA|nr:unnamed protein product [Adineta steineri]